MTGTNDKIRSLFLATLMVLSVFAMSTAFTGTVAAQDRVPGNTDRPLVVFPLEEVDISGVAQSDSGPRIGTGAVTLEGVSGDADGETIDGTAEDFDVGDATPGGYSSDGDNGAEIIVRDPAVTSISVFRGAGNTDPSNDVTDGSVPEGQSSLTVRARWDFASQEAPVSGTVDGTFLSSEWVFVGILEGDVDITDQIGGRRSITTDLGMAAPAYVGEEGSGGHLTLDNIDDLETGSYTIYAAGLGDGSYDVLASSPSPFDSDRGAVATSSLEIRDPGETISLRESEVTRGSTATGDVTGQSGDTVFVRMRTGNEIDGADHEDVYNLVTDVVQDRSSVNIDGTDYFRAELALGADGEAPFQINTSALEADTTTTFEVTPGATTSSPEDSVDLQVNAREVTITEMPNAVVIGEEFTIQGEAPRSDRVKAWARIGSDYDVLLEPGGTQATADVSGDGSFEIDVASGHQDSPIALPESYRIVITADEADNPDAGMLEGDVEMTTGELNELDVRTTTSLRTVTGELSVRLSSNTIAAGVADELEMEGNALGQGETIRLYIVGPRGEVTDAGGAEITALGGADTISVVDEAFDDELSAFDIRGSYQIAVAGPGRNQDFEADTGADLDGRTQSEAMEVLNDEYDQPGSDDVLVVETVQAQNAMLTIDDFRTNGQVAQGEVELSGQSNRQDETLVFLEVIDENDDVVVSSEGEVNGSSNSWNGSIDLSDVETGTYTLRADDDEAAATLEFELVEETSTPTPTEADDTPTETDTPEPDTPTDTDTPEPDTETDTETAGDQTPGFTVLVALLALVAAALLAVRRNS